MPCTNCMAPFTHFRKEHGCSNCSFSFCAKCLPRKIILPQLSRQPVSVCQNCYDKLTQRSTNRIQPNRTTGGNPVNLNPFEQRPPSPPPDYTEYPSGAGYEVSTRQLSSKDQELKNRLDKLKSDVVALEGSNQKVLSVSEIEERLAALRGITVEEVRCPSLMFVKKRNALPSETVETLMEKARAEAMIEKKWDPVNQLEKRYREYHGIEEQDNEDEIAETSSEKYKVNQGTMPSTSDDILFSEDTVRNLRELKRTLTDAEATSKEASASLASESKMQDEMKEIMKITRQKSLKNEKINAEMQKFWERSFEKYGGEENDSGGEGTGTSEIEEAELKKILKEAEQAVDEEKNLVDEAKKRPKRGFFSKLFRSSDD